ncbi:cell division protein FtsQ/DivIB [Inmirania thermothiophila]|uniref:Cell division protein FtsQ n=1 Tax=Inmirania thermothiophila TaxID=1750597 RepID=A0A3N1XTV1_9GAMM|nr:FtsQ-type POTRA domain-containing protein [Inmirania thermothiophila]ROR29688.1 cell division protein FtsQ [Inmirania thermothiophila]
MRRRRGAGAVPRRAAARRPRAGRVAGALLLAAAGGAAAWGALRVAAWAADPATFPVRRVEVAGTLRHTAPAAVRRALMPYVRAGLVRMDAAAARAAVEALPWVARAGVRRLWPDAVRVEVEERRAVARWGARELVDAAGVRFAPEPASWPPGLVRIDAPDGREAEAVALLARVQARLAEAGLRPVRLRWDARGAVGLVLADGVAIEVGRERTEARLARFVRAFGAALAPRWKEVERVDLRYANGFAVRWRAASGAGADAAGGAGGRA